MAEIGRKKAKNGRGRTAMHKKQAAMIAKHHSSLYCVFQYVMLSY